MKHPTYSFKDLERHRYAFISSGKSHIYKIVEFSPIAPEAFNLAFGDLLPNDSMDDSVHSNNGDIIKVLATVIKIVTDFTSKHPESRIFFKGSTPERTKLYARILKVYHDELYNEFVISGVQHLPGGSIKAVIFDRKHAFEYSAFIIQKIN